MDYVFEDEYGEGSQFTVQPGSFFGDARKTYISGRREGAVEYINDVQAGSYRRVAEGVYGKYIPGNIFTSPRFEPGSERQTLPVYDSGGIQSGYIDESGPHEFSPYERMRQGN
jgi:hypothetical protein